MPRLCSDSSRSYTPQGGTILSPGRSASLAMRSASVKDPGNGPPGNQGPGTSGMLSPDMSETSDSQRKQRFLIAPCRATCRVMGQKSVAAVAIAQRPG